jgi:hypothetical protein
VHAVRYAISGGGSSSSAPSTSSDARRAVDAQHELDRTVGEMKKKLSVEHWEALQDRKEAAGLREKMKGHVKEPRPLPRVNEGNRGWAFWVPWRVRG